MPDEERSEQLLLVDLHLERLEEDQAAELEAALADSPELAARSRTLGDILHRLDAYEAPDPPADLVDAVMARIDEQAGILPFREPVSAVPAGTAQEMSASPVLSLRELIAIAACITLFVGVFVPGYFKARNVARRTMCQRNLAQLSRAMHTYGEDNDGYLAYAGFVPNGSWLPTRTPDVRRYSNTRPLYLLLRGRYLPQHDPRVFLCPAAASARPMLAEDYDEFSDFAEEVNVSYSYMFMNLPQGRRIRILDPRMVVLADRSPLFDKRVARHQISPYDESVNSFTHEDGAGQNAIYAHGGGGWFTEPTIGVDRDDIYRAGDLVRYQGTEKPVSDHDTMLVP